MGRLTFWLVDEGEYRELDSASEQVHLTQCLNKVALESQPAHKTVNLLFTITN